MIGNYKESVEVYYKKYINNDIDNNKIYEEKKILTKEAKFEINKGRSWDNGQLKQFENKELIIFEDIEISLKDKIIVKDIEYKIISIDDSNKYYIIIELMENEE
jgi:hypothetical protein